ncbi:SDR family oxidoreductase [Cytobacillus purgationiresistens]|uniref:NAD(P)-dependent dehydrogenase (Short-subunit alcohol dehydrogenase family) n=1 Tax=Cytobacillus purgationiresistens TaxID=863449 RepID=A0ABU0APW1_9BACI|nr:SDR family oxidoreductase [Cytobacillus purgationiresistens]MDQ0272812.1 NAD(P)-dependent dehydrogenase (short-subunit alcohol dehydrogenase family) [Cytobacillus purgationiresistens]
MNKKLAIVTGANSGMGLATVISLAKKDIHVIMLCRNEERGANALQLAKKESQSEHIELMIGDLGSIASIHRFAETFKAKYETLDILINNAGVVSLKRQHTKDGFESMLGVNHLGHYLLTHLLLDHLKATQDGRVIVVSSGAHKWGKIDFNDPYFDKGYNVMKGYGRSKLANVLFARGLAKRLEGTSVTVNALHPGAVATNIGVDRNTGFGKNIIKLLVPFFRTPEKGAATAVFLATNPDVKGVSGAYFYNEKEVPISNLAGDDELVERFWTWSKEQVGL